MKNPFSMAPFAQEKRSWKGILACDACVGAIKGAHEKRIGEYWYTCICAKKPLWNLNDIFFFLLGVCGSRIMVTEEIRLAGAQPRIKTSCHLGEDHGYVRALNWPNWKWRCSSTIWFSTTTGSWLIRIRLLPSHSSIFRRAYPSRSDTTISRENGLVRHSPQASAHMLDIQTEEILISPSTSACCSWIFQRPSLFIFSCSHEQREDIKEVKYSYVRTTTPEPQPQPLFVNFNFSLSLAGLGVYSLYLYVIWSFLCFNVILFPCLPRIISFPSALSEYISWMGLLGCWAIFSLIINHHTNVGCLFKGSLRPPFITVPPSPQE